MVNGQGSSGDDELLSGNDGASNGNDRAPDTPLRRVTIRDVARRCGLSTATVSLVLNGQSHRYTEQTAARVRRAVAELGYRPNVLAQGLRTSRTQTIGVLSDRIITTPFATGMIQGVEAVCSDHGFLAFVVECGEHPDSWRQAIEALSARQVDGLIVGTMYHKSTELAGTVAGLPTVAMNLTPLNPDLFGVAPDETNAAIEAVNHLISLGHRRIAHITLEESDGLAVEQRIDGYMRAMTDAGLSEYINIRRTDPTLGHSDGAERVCQEMLSSSGRPTAILAYNDRMAIGLYRVTRDLNIDVPQQLSVIGVDDHELIASELRPALTTMALPHYEMGVQAASNLISHLDEDSSEGLSGVHLITMPLIHRESTSLSPD